MGKNKKIIIFLAVILLFLIIVNIVVYYRDSIKQALFEMLPLASISQPVYPQATLLRMANNHQIWMYDQGVRRQVPDAATFEDLGFDWQAIKIISQEELDKIPRVKYIQGRRASETYFLTETGYKLLMPDLEILQNDGFTEADIYKIRDAEVIAYPETALITLKDDPRVYKIEQDRKRPINLPQTFEMMFSWDQVVEVSQLHADRYPEGDEITAALWAENDTVAPLQKQVINFKLPFYTGLEVAVADGQGQTYLTKKYVFPEKEAQFSFQVGGALGKQTVSLMTGGKMITPLAEFVLAAETSVVSGDEKLDNFYPQVKSWLENDVSYCQGIRGYRSSDTWPIWLRDHAYQSKGFKYFEQDMTKILDWFLENQRPDGSFVDYCPGSRMEVEADVEYLMVSAVYWAWQATGDDQWMFETLDQLEQGLRYSLNSGQRWDIDLQLIKRPFTCDTWDFHWHTGAVRIDGSSKFGILSGDNSGFYQAAVMLSKMFAVKGDLTKQVNWQVVADHIKEKSNEYLWSEDLGYYLSFLHIDPPEPAVETDESLILSLSNVYNINRADFASQEQAASVIEEYKKRANLAIWQGQPYLQEWFSVYPDYGDDKWGVPSANQSGKYVNGGFMPLVGGELAKASLTRGFEDYGYQEILQYLDLTANGQTYLWYWPDGTPGITGNQTLSSDGWGSAAFLSAFIEGLVGVVDLDNKFNIVQVAPRWPVTGLNDIKATIKYGASDGYLAYQWQHDKEDRTISLVLTGSGEIARFHLMLPPDTRALSVTLDGQMISYDQQEIGQSLYVDFESMIKGLQEIVIAYE
jgi:hypothetical protein